MSKAEARLTLEKGTSLWKDAWLRLRKNKLAMAGLFIVLLICFSCFVFLLFLIFCFVVFVVFFLILVLFVVSFSASSFLASGIMNPSGVSIETRWALCSRSAVVRPLRGPIPDRCQQDFGR